MSVDQITVNSNEVAMLCAHFLVIVCCTLCYSEERQVVLAYRKEVAASKLALTENETLQKYLRKCAEHQEAMSE